MMMADAEILKIGPWGSFRKGFEKETHRRRYLIPTITWDRIQHTHMGDYYFKGTYDHNEGVTLQIGLTFWKWSFFFWMAWNRIILYKAHREIRVSWDMDQKFNDLDTERCLKLQAALEEAGVEFTKWGGGSPDDPLKVTLVAAYHDGGRQELEVDNYFYSHHLPRLYDWLHEHDEVYR